MRIRQPEQEVNGSLNTSGNPDNNSWTGGFTYDNNGNVLTTTDAKGTTITNTYDALNRALTRTYSDGTPTVTNYYDGAGLLSVPDHSKGKLTKVASSVSESKYTEFDLLGRLKESQQVTDGTTYTSKYTYNLSGALVEQEYPSGRTVKSEFDNNGDLARIVGKTNSSATEHTYATAFSYFADGKIEKLRLGNGLWESAKLNSRLQVTELAMGHSVGEGSLMKLNYDYGELQTNGTVDATKNAGNIAKQTVNFSGLANPLVQTYKYDSLDRITEAIEKVNGTQSWKQTFDYDRYGNRTSFYQIVGSQELTMNNLTLPTVDSATNRFAGSQGYSYDKNGNVTADAASSGRTFIFNGDNKQTEVKNSSNVTIGTYYYEGNGKRVKKVTDLETTIFVYDGLGKLVAEYSNATPPTDPTINYTATDQLGSPRVITDAFGQVVARRDFMPFGEELYADGTYRKTTDVYSTSGEDSVRQRFTGYQKDIETGLDFAEARYYNNQHGRFTAVDPLLASGKSANPQTFNRYAYVMNRPLTLRDPTGLQAATIPLNDDPNEVIATIVTHAYEWLKRTFSYGGQSVTVKDRVPAFESLSNSDPLQNASMNIFNSYMNSSSGNYDGVIDQKLLGFRGPNVGKVLAETNNATKNALLVADIGFGLQNAILGGAGMTGSSNALSTNRGIALPRGGGSEVEMLNPNNLNFTDSLSRSSLKANASSIYQNGIQKPIDFTRIGGQDYILDGNNRSAIALRFGQQVPGIRRPLPFKAWTNSADVINANNTNGNAPYSSRARNFFQWWKP